MGGFSNALLDRIAGPGQAPVAPVNPLDQQEKQAAIAESGQAQQLNSQKIQQQQMQLEDQKTLRSLQPQFVQKDESGKPTGYDWNGLIAAAQGKVMPATLFGLQKQQSDLRQSMATATKEELANQKEVNGELYQRAEGLKGIADPQERQKHYESTLGWAQQHGVDVRQWPAAAPDNDHITSLESGFGMHAQALADQKTAADTKSAEAKSLLDAAQAEAANYKEDPNLGLIDLRTKQPVSPNALAPLGPGEAEVLGKKPGDMVPLKLKNTANEIVNRGIHVTSANGRQIMVDGQGNTIKDLGTATPVVVNNIANQTGAGKDAAVVAKQFGMTPDAFDQQAEKYFTTGQLPQVGRGGNGLALQRALMNRSAELHPNASLAGNEAAYKANAASLSKLQTNFDQVSAFEGTAQKNLDLYLDTLSKIPDLGVKFANVPLRKLDSSMIGSDNYQSMKAAQQTAATETAKVLGSAAASGVLSDTQKKDAEDVVSGNLSYSAAKRVVATIKQDFANRHQSYADQIADIQKRMGGVSGPASQTQSAASPKFQVGQSVKLKNGKTVKITAVHDDGSFDAQ